MHTLVKESGGTLVVRPDSGHPPDVIVKLLQIFERKIGMRTNRKAFKVLPDYFRLIQGDGIDRQMTERILAAMKDAGYSASNIAFGSGGGLLQKVDRDTQQWAFKCCAAELEGVGAVEVRKHPATDIAKRSKGGRLDLIRDGAEHRTIALAPGQNEHPLTVMNTVFEGGRILFHNTFAQCRTRMGAN